ncbi:MAG TPA: hypothetical protein ACFCUD_02975 [Cyclobacteriaceae bacterium]
MKRFFSSLILVCYFLLLVTHSLKAQNLPLGQWRTHFNYQSAKLVEQVNDKIYSASNSGLFFIDKSDNSINVLSKNDGLSNVGVTAIAFNESVNVLLIGYQSGDIDIINDEGVDNFEVIAQSQGIGSKRINNICFRDDIAYIASDVGMVVLDLQQVEIVESYLELGPNGEDAEVLDCHIFQDQLYLITAFELITAPLDQNLNLIDFRNWQRVEDTLFEDRISSLATLGNQLIAGSDTTIFELRNNQWEALAATNNVIQSLHAFGDGVAVLTKNHVFELQDGTLTEIQYNDSQNPRDIILDGNVIWVADDGLGLVSRSNGSAQVIIPSGPQRSPTIRIIADAGNVISIPSFQNFGLPTNNNQFSNFTGQWRTSTVEDFRNVSTAIQSDNMNAIGSYGDGLLINGEVFDDTSSPLVKSGTDILVTDVKLTRDNNLWVANYDSSIPLHFFNNGAWRSISFPFINANFPLEIEIDQGENIWLLQDRNPGIGGLVGYNPTDDTNIAVNSSNTGLGTNTVLSFAVDLEDQLWIGTPRGPFLMPNASISFFTPDITVFKPVLDNDFLLESEVINSVAVDGANRKWFGTNSGVWVFDERDESVFNFNFDNSPLPSDTILDIAVQRLSGEVFIATSSGMVSYQSSSSLGQVDHSNVKIFPNPVRPGYAGLVGINGLVNNATVNIVTSTGKLVRALISNGGTASWDVRDYRGKRVETGIYLVISADETGEETFVGKIAVIN